MTNILAEIRQWTTGRNQGAGKRWKGNSVRSRLGAYAEARGTVDGGT